MTALVETERACERWLFPPHIKWRRSYGPIEQLWMATTTMLSIYRCRCCPRNKWVRRAAGTLANEHIEVLWQPQEYKKTHGTEKYNVSVKSLIDLQRTAIYSRRPKDSAIYVWMHNSFTYIGKSNLQKRHRKTQSGVGIRWLEHMTFSCKRDIPGSDKYRYRLAAKVPKGNDELYGIEDRR